VGVGVGIPSLSKQSFQHTSHMTTFEEEYAVSVATQAVGEMTNKLGQNVSLSNVSTTFSQRHKQVRAACF